MCKEVKEKLTEKIIDESICMEPIVLHLIKYDDLDFILEKIDFDSKELTEDKINANQFIDLLTYFIENFRKYFFSAIGTERMIRNIIVANHDRMEDYFKIKDPVGIFNNNKIADKKMYQLFINNFIYNSKYSPLVQKVLEEHDLMLLKDIDLYSFDESFKIVKLLSDFAFCQRGNAGRIEDLFTNKDCEIAEVIDFTKQRKKRYYKESEDEKIRTKYIKYCIEEYEKIYRAYKVREKYLRYFR